MPPLDSTVNCQVSMQEMNSLLISTSSHVSEQASWTRYTVVCMQGVS